MHPDDAPALLAVVVEREIEFTLLELGHAGGADHRLLHALVRESVIEPDGSDPAHWRFDGSALRRVRQAHRLVRDLALTPAGAALVLDLLDEIAALRARLLRRSAG